jgi:transposase
MQSEETWMELHVLHDHGWSIAALAREFGLDWRTARRYARTGKPPRYRPRACPAQLTDAQLAHIERRLAGCPNLRVTVLIRELAADYGYTGSYTSLRRRIVTMRPRADAEPVIRFETAPGVQTQGDWTDCGMWPLGQGSAELFAWVSVLGCSRMPAIRFATDKTRPTTLRAIVRTIDDLGGATAEFLTDRDTALMAGSRADGSAILSFEWADVAANLGTRPRACRAYRAQTKGKVERLNRELKRGPSRLAVGPGPADSPDRRRLRRLRRSLAARGRCGSPAPNHETHRGRSLGGREAALDAGVAPTARLS